MKCPVCGTESKLFAEMKPNGRIGCFCRECGKGYITRDPEKGWDESKFYSKVGAEDISYFKQVHGIDLMKEIYLQIFEVEFEKFIRGDPRMLDI